MLGSSYQRKPGSRLIRKGGSLQKDEDVEEGTGCRMEAFSHNSLIKKLLERGDDVVEETRTGSLPWGARSQKVRMLAVKWSFNTGLECVGRQCCWAHREGTESSHDREDISSLQTVSQNLE